MKIRLLILCMALLFAGCSKQDLSLKKPVVLVSIPPYAYFVERIAQDKVDVQTLVPPGANPHIYEPSPKDVEKAMQAVIWLKIGESFEQKISTVLKEQAPHLRAVEMWQDIPLIVESGHHCSHHDHHHVADLHIWLSPKLAQIQAKTIARNLIEKFPEHSAFFENQLKDFLKDLEDLDQKFTSILEPLDHKTILVSHPAFGYFCRDYKIEQLSIESEGKDPRPQHITEILKQAQITAIRTVITQPQYNNKGAQLIAEKLLLPISSIDPYSADYITNLQTLAQDIANPKN